LHFTSGERALGTNWLGGCVGPRGKSFFPARNQTLVVQSIVRHGCSITTENFCNMWLLKGNFMNGSELLVMLLSVGGVLHKFYLSFVCSMWMLMLEMIMYLIFLLVEKCVENNVIKLFTVTYVTVEQQNKNLLWYIKVKVKQSHYTPWRRLGGEEV
jgi:hypothetical protein